MKTLYKSAENEAYSINETFTRKIDEDSYFISTRHGGWVLLTEEEFQDFKEAEFDQNDSLFLKLKENGIILTQDNMGQVKSSLRERHSRLFKPPTYHVIPVSESCNLNCEYCHPDAKPGKGLMDRDMGNEILEFIFSIPDLKDRSVKLVFSGGEPLMNFEVVRYMAERARELAKENKVELKTSMMSNLTLMDDDIADSIDKNNIQLGTSLDGPKELHNKQRHYGSGNGTYEDVVYWIERFKEKYGKTVGAIPVITKMTLDYGAQAFVDSYVDLGQKEVFLKPYRPQGRAKNKDKLAMSPEEFFSFYKEALDYCIELWKDGVTMKERLTRELVENFISSSRNCMCRDKPCGAGLTMLSWNREGDVIACDSLRSEEEARLGNVKEDSYLDIRAAALPLVSMTTDVTPECSQCAFSPFCSTCPGNAFGQRDDPMPKPPLNFECKWQKKAFETLIEKFKDEEEAEILKNWTNEYQRKTKKRTKFHT